MNTEPDYLIFSYEHRAWWGPNHSGYTQRLHEAGRYSQGEAIDICANALFGTHGLSPLPEYPVRLADVEHMVRLHRASMTTWGRAYDTQEWE
jgi:hypothetical protein